jgi:hypothetical protein
MMGKVIAAVGSRILVALLSEKVIIAILIRLGDWLVKRTTNSLDDQIWGEVKKALEKEDG